MECNKGDAQKAKEIAEKKLMEKDVAGAKKFAVKAQHLYPELDGLSQFVAVLEVYISAERGVNGEVDWYRVLNVAPSADEESIRKNYRKLALFFHPDKNKSVGADGAFKILSEAWSVLSHKARRSLYDQNRNLNALYDKFPSNVSVPAGRKGSNNSSKHKQSDAPPHMSSVGSKPAQHRPSFKANTFWTMCNYCKIQFEYLVVYRSVKLRCRNCQNEFIGIEVPSPDINGSSSPTIPYRMQQKTPAQNTRTEGPRSTKKKTVPATKRGYSAHLSSIESDIKSVSQGDKTKRRHVETKTTSGTGAISGSDIKSDVLKKKVHIDEPRMHNITWEPVNQMPHGNVGGSANVNSDVLKKKVHIDEPRVHNITWEPVNQIPHGNVGGSANVNSDVLKKKVHIDEPRVHNITWEPVNQMPHGNVGGSANVKSDVLKKKVHIDEPRVHNITWEPVNQTPHGNVGGSANVSRKTSSKTGSMNSVELLNIRDALMTKAKSSISEMIKKWNNEAAASKNLEKGLADKELTKQKGDFKSRNVVAKNRHGLEAGKKKVQAKNSCPVHIDNDNDNHLEINILSMNVPDPDFHNFDEDRAEKSFGRDQVWAAYDDDDGMPRFYAMIHDVISLKPFKMNISWLNTKSNRELSPTSWLESGFYKTSGEFWIGKRAIYKSLNSFSHTMKWIKGARGSIHIYPNMGDVWALYRKWSPDWNALTPDEVIHKYDMVEILEGFSEDEGVTVGFLVKVAGFKAVFRQQSDPTKRMTIPKEEMFRFSHQIPFHVLTGEEGNNVPKGCLELDPASTPLELLQVLTETQVEELMKEAENDLLPVLTKTQVEELMKEAENDLLPVLTETQVEELMKEAENAKDNDQNNDQPNDAGFGKEPESVENGKTGKRKTEPDNVPENDAKRARKSEENDNREANY